MTKTKYLIAVATLAVVVALGSWAFWARSPSPGVAESTVEAADATLPPKTVQLPPVTQPEPSCGFSPSYRASYHYEGKVSSKVLISPMAGDAIDGVQTFEGTLALEAVVREGTDWLVLAQFQDMNDETMKAHGADFTQPFMMKVGSRCELKGFGRAKAASRLAAQVQQIAMHDAWVFVPLEGRSESVSYENGTGLASASVTRSGRVVTRQIHGYHSVWRTKARLQVLHSLARAELGEHWLERFESTEGISAGLLQSALATLKLERRPLASAEISATLSRQAKDYVWESLLHSTFAEVAGVDAVPPSERPYMERMKNHTLESAFSTMMQKVEAKENIESQWHEMTGFLNQHPAQIEEYAKGLVASDFPQEGKAVAFMALGRTVHPQAREALMQIRGQMASGSLDRMRATLALVTRKDVGIELAHELRKDALTSDPTRQDEYYNSNAAMHLGILGRLQAQDAEVVAVAKETALTLLRRAGDDPVALMSPLGAIGNLAEPSLLSTLEGYTRHPDPKVRAQVPRGFRQYPYAQTEKLMADWLRRETDWEVKQEIFNILYHQLADAQRSAGEPIVREAVKHLAEQPRVLSRQSMIHILGQVKNNYPEVREQLLNQLAVEFGNRSGLYSQITHYLLPEEITLALSRMPEFAHQFDAAAKQRVQAEANAATRKVMEDIAEQERLLSSLGGGK